MRRNRIVTQHNRIVTQHRQSSRDPTSIEKSIGYISIRCLVAGDPRLIHFYEGEPINRVCGQAHSVIGYKASSSTECALDAGQASSSIAYCASSGSAAIPLFLNELDNVVLFFNCVNQSIYLSPLFDELLLCVFL